MLLLQASHCVTKESVSLSGHTCHDPSFMLLITFKLGGRSMHLVLFLISGLSASCGNILMANKPEWGSSMNSGTVPVTIHGVQFVGTVLSAMLVVAEINMSVVLR